MATSNILPSTVIGFLDNQTQWAPSGITLA